MADDYEGEPVMIDWATSHLLVIGRSGSGKGSISADLITEMIPFIHAGLAQLAMIDLKGGMESAFYRPILSEEATDIDAAVALIGRWRKECAERAYALSGITRAHQPTNDQPRRVLLIDEAGELFRQDRKTRDALKQDLQSLVMMGRAAGYIVWAMTQDPRVESFPVRDGFSQRICLRVSKSEARLVLGDDAIRSGATPWCIPSSRPGTAWIWDDERHRARLFRADYFDDDELRDIVNDC